MTKEIPLTQGKFALVDDDVYEWASEYKWYADGKAGRLYARRNEGTWPFQKAVRLHREILNAPEGIFIDHINGDGLDCRRINMRLASSAENQRNRSTPANNKSGYKGVSWYKPLSKWRAAIKAGDKTMHIGYFDDLEAAARAYDDAARKYHGEFARTNF